MESLDPHSLAGLTNQRLNSFPHLGSGLIGKGDRENLRWPKFLGGEQVRDAVCEHPGFSTTGTGDDQQCFSTVQHSLALLRI